MGKTAVTQEETPVAEPEKRPESEEKKPKKKKKQKNETEKARMPWGRTVLPALVFIAGSSFLLYQHNPCGISNKNRKDCGYSGISTFGCLTRGYTTNPFKSERYLPLKASSKKVAVWSDKGVEQLLEAGKYEELGSPKAGSTLGSNIKVDMLLENGMAEMKDGGPSVQVLFEQDDGSFKVDNKNLPGKVEGLGYRASPKYDDGMKDMSYAVWGGIVTGEKVAKGKWLKVTSSSKDDPHSMRLKQFGLLFAKLFATAVALWFASGYPAQSLGWYFVLCAGLAYRFNMCCYDASVEGDVAHCYLGGGGPF